MLQIFDPFARWLGDTSLSHSLRELLTTVVWVAPAIQSVHILSIATLIGAAGAINLRMLGLVARESSLADIVRRFAPVIWGALVVLFISGSAIILNRPRRYFHNWSFLTKVVLIMIGIGLLIALQRAVRRNPQWGSAIPAEGPARPLAIFTLVIWVGVIFAGRWIAYAR